MALPEKAQLTQKEQAWTNMTVVETATALDTDITNGLTSASHDAQLRAVGPNQLPAAHRHHPIIIFLKNFIEPLALLLLAVAIISAAISEYKEMGVILGIVIINAAIGTFQEIKSRNSLDALKKLSSPKTIVRRDGVVMEVETWSLVPGDIVMLDAGKFVPADLRIIEAAQLQIDESALTGESQPATKTVASLALAGNKVAIGDQNNMAFMSTFVTKGRLVGIVTATALQTEMGKIAAMLAATKETKTPLQRKLAQLVRWLSLFAIAAGVVILLWKLLLLSLPISSSLIAAIAMAVAMVPESLPLIVSVILAFGVGRMARRHAIIKKLPVVEVLGSVNVICSDKTGTITQNRITVTHFLHNNVVAEVTKFPTNQDTQQLVQAIALCHDAAIGVDQQQIGDPTEFALVDFIGRLHLDMETMRHAAPRVDEHPFDSQRKLMSTVHPDQKAYIVYTKGAIDVLVNRCTGIVINGKVEPFVKYRDVILAQAETMSNQALRVLGFAYKKIAKLEGDHERYEHELIFVGAVGMMDPIRPEVFTAVQRARDAAIRTVMITGDHRTTAAAIAKQLGIITSEDQAITGIELDAMDDDALMAQINQYRVFSRVAPEHKVRVVNCLQRQGLVVAMTGDGVNDGPSLQTADVGIAMGITGTDVAKEASGMILTDDNFSTIVDAVEEGRNIYQKIKRSIAFVLSTNFSEVIAVFLVLAIAQFQMLTSIQILWVNLIVESVIAIPLGMDINDSDVMKRAPRSGRESLLRHIIWRIVVVTIVTAGSVLAAFFIGHEQSNGVGQTMSFLVMATAPMVTVLALRADKWVFFTKRMFGNKKLLLAIAIGLVLNALLIFVSPIASFVGLKALDGIHVVIALALILVPALTLECAKIVWTRVSIRQA